MKASEQAKMLREMAAPPASRAREYAQRSIASDNAGHIDLARLEKSLAESAASEAAALLAGAEALEAMLPKQTSANTPSTQKAEMLSALADTADALARLDCQLTDRAAMAQRAALFRECAAMMRERCKPKDPWYLVHERVYKRFDISVTEALHGYWHWMVEGDGCIKRGAEVGLVAAQAAAIAWADKQEGK